MDSDTKTEGEKQFTINDFPLEILAYIFSFLEVQECIRIEIVCKRWRDVTVTIPWQFNSLKKEQFPRFMTENKFVAILKRCGRSLQHLDMREIPRFQPIRLSIISHYCPNLTSITITEENDTSNTELETFFTNCSQIKILTVIDNDEIFTEDDFVKVLRMCKNLESLSIHYNDFFTGQCFSLLSNKLTTLCLKNCHVTHQAFQQLQVCTDLQELTLEGCFELDHSSFNFISDRFSHTLKKLHLIHQNNIDFNQVSFVRFSKLEELIITYSKLTASTFEELLKKCPMLWKLTIQQNRNFFLVPKRALQLLAMHPKIVDLNISNFQEHANDELVQLALLGKLEALTISGCDWVTEKTCLALTEHCKNLRYLDISGCRISSDFIRDVQLQERSVKLTIIAGGNNLIQSIWFITSPNLVVKNIDLCPPRPRFSLVSAAYLSDI